MLYILGTLLRKALSMQGKLSTQNDEVWKQLMLIPMDYGDAALHDEETRRLMDLIGFEHGGPKYDEKYPDGIPTSIVITDSDYKTYDSGMVMYPAGHARNQTANLVDLLQNKFKKLASLAVNDVDGLLKKLDDLQGKTADEIQTLYETKMNFADQVFDKPSEDH